MDQTYCQHCNEPKTTVSRTWILGWAISLDCDAEPEAVGEKIHELQSIINRQARLLKEWETLAVIKSYDLTEIPTCE